MLTPRLVPKQEKVWNDLFKNKVEKDDPLWKEYVEKAAAFDTRMVDEWNKIVDVILVYVALFISVLTSFVIQTSTQTKRDPALITNDLLVAIYNQLAAQANNTTIPPADIANIFHQDKIEHRTAVTCNALLYTSLALCTVVSVIALAAKLWLVSYSHRAFSVGSPYERAMRRQEAYSGILAWNMGTVINAMPLILLIALILFGFFVHTSVKPLEQIIGYLVGTILGLGLISLGVTSIGAAFVPACPFRSVFSAAIGLIFEIPQRFLKTILSKVLGVEKQKIRWLWMGCLAFLWVSFSAVVAYAAMNVTSAWLIVVFAPVAITLAYAAQHKVDHRTQDHMIPHLAGWVIVIIELVMAAAAYFTGNTPHKYSGFITLYGFGMLVLVLAGWMGCGMSKSMTKTGEIDAIAWLLRSTPSQDPKLFKKAGQMVRLPVDSYDAFSLVDSNGHLPVEYYGSQYRPRLLKSLMPLLSLLITSHTTAENSNADQLSTHSSKILEKKHIKSKKVPEGLLTSLTPELQADPVATAPHHIGERPNSDPSSLTSKAIFLEETNIRTKKLHTEDLQTSLNTQVHSDPAAHHGREHSNSHPSPLPSKAIFLEEKNIHTTKLKTEGLPSILSRDQSSESAIDEDMKNLQIYVSCLALLSDFQEYEGSLWCLREDAKRHPKLERQLLNKLVKLASHSYPPNLRSAAVKVLKNYHLDINGKPLPEVLGLAPAVVPGYDDEEAAIEALTAESPV